MIKFNKLDQLSLRHIVNKFVLEMNDLLSDKSIKVRLTESAVDHVIEQGYDSKMGARPMARKISDLIKVPLSRKILFEKLSGGTVVVVDYRDNKIEFDLQYSVSVTPSIDSNGYIVLDGIKS